MKTSFKTNWVMIAGLALVLPVSGVLSGCGGGSGGSNPGGGGGVGGGVQSPFARVTGSSPLTRNGTNIGALSFTVNNFGTITGTLTGATIAPRSAGAKADAKNAPRATVTSTSTVATNGGFTLAFNVNIGGVDQVITFTGTLSVSGGVAFLNTATVTSSAAGTFGVNFTVSVGGNPNPGNGTFAVSGGNATGGNIGGTADTLTAVRSGNQIIGLLFTFSSAGLGGSQTVSLSVNDGAAVTAKTYSIAGGDASAGYIETPLGNPQGSKSWEATAGNVQITSITGTTATVSVSNLTLTPATVVGNAATGTVTLSGSGTLTIQ